MNPIINYLNNNYAAALSLYCVLLVCVVIITTLLSQLCVILKEKAHLSDGVVAGILLGVITSLPELVTCIASVIVHGTGSIGFGDIIGSNIFDIFILSICLLVCVWIFIDNKSNRINFFTLLFTGVGTIFVLLAMIATKYIPQLIWHGFNFFSILVLLSYGAAIFFLVRQPQTKPNHSKEGMTEIIQARKSLLFKLRLKWVIVLIVVVSLILIISAVFLTFTSESLIFTHWSSVFGTEDKASFGGALLLGVVTSLPEIVCAINLCTHKEYNMIIDTIVGSTSFNLSIIAIANIVFACLSEQTGVMYEFTTHSLIQIIVCVVMIIVMLMYLLANSKKFKSKFNKKQILAINITTLTITSAAYIAFLILGFVNK